MKSRRGCGCETHPQDRLLRDARWQHVQPRTSAHVQRGGADARGLNVAHAIAPEAFAKEVDKDQAANSYGSPTPSSDGSSPSLVWPIRSSAWQHVPSELTPLEHVWKDGDPRHLPRCETRNSNSSCARSIWSAFLRREVDVHHGRKTKRIRPPTGIHEDLPSKGNRFFLLRVGGAE